MDKLWLMVTQKRKSGIKGENAAIRYLSNEGYQIVRRNYRHSYCEIDLIATKSDVLCFIEVKSRSSITYGYPEQFVGRKQMKCIMKAAGYYTDKNHWTGRIRFDIISILPGEIHHFEDAF